MRSHAAALVVWSLSLAMPAGADVPPSGDAPTDPADAEMGRKLQQTLAAHGSEIHGCYAEALVDKPGLAGEVLLRLHVAPGGVVARVDVLKDQTGSVKLTDCLLHRMQTWKEPSLAGDAPLQLVFPLAFKPDEGKPGAKPGAVPPAASPPRALRYVVPLVEGKPGPLGRGKVEARVLVSPQLVGATEVSLTHMVLHPMARLALHSHPGSTEILYVLSGLARVRDPASTLYLANAGDAIVLPAGQVHSLESAPMSSLTMLQFFVPAGPEHAYLDARDRSGTVAAQKSRAVKSDNPVVDDNSVRRYPILGGKGQVGLFLDGKLGPAPVASLQRFEASAGAEVPMHTHDDADETLYILSGEGEMAIGDLVIPISAGNAIHVPKKTRHSLKVTEKIVAVQCYAPGGPEQRFKPNNAEKAK